MQREWETGALSLSQTPRVLVYIYSYIILEWDEGSRLHAARMMSVSMAPARARESAVTLARRRRLSLRWIEFSALSLSLSCESMLPRAQRLRAGSTYICDCILQPIWMGAQRWSRRNDYFGLPAARNLELWGYRIIRSCPKIMPRCCCCCCFVCRGEEVVTFCPRHLSLGFLCHYFVAVGFVLINREYTVY